MCLTPPAPPPQPPALATPSSAGTGRADATRSVTRSVRFIHFNDVYNISPAPVEPVGGAARFVPAVRAARAASPHPALVLFSGDAFSPAPLTPLTDGAEIPPVLDALPVHVACMGNHDVDRGLPVLRARVAETSFPWLLSNLDVVPGSADDDYALYHDNSQHSGGGEGEGEGEEGVHENNERRARPLGGLRRTHVVTVADNLVVGFMGLAGFDWVPTLDKVSPHNLIYTDFCQAADTLAAQLRAQGCHVIVALTHMREPDDERLAREAKDVDIILGGHDHIESSKLINGRWVVKSGTDFKNFSTTDVKVEDDGRVVVGDPVHHDVTSEVEADAEMEKFVGEQLDKLGPGYFERLAMTSVHLDGRFVSIRTRETGLGNFLCDAMAHAMGVPIALINAGSFRSDSVDPPGLVTRQTVDAILPFQDEVLVVRYTGRELLGVLENAVSQYPLLDGRFLQVSGVRFSFDPRRRSTPRPAHSAPRGGGPRAGTHTEAEAECREAHGRVIAESVHVRVLPANNNKKEEQEQEQEQDDDNDEGEARFEPLDLDREYLVAVKSFVFLGKDGFPAGNPGAVVRRAERHLPDMFVDQLRALRPRVEVDGAELAAIAPRRERRIVCLHEDELLKKRYDRG